MHILFVENVMENVTEPSLQWLNQNSDQYITSTYFYL